VELKKYIKIYDDVLPLSSLSSFLRYINTLNFEKAGVLGNNNPHIDFNVRRTYLYPLDNLKHESLTNVHWACFLGNAFLAALAQYSRDNNIIDFNLKGLRDMGILKYEQNGFYTWHTDHAAEAPRTMSCIYLLNNDYEGGNLCFRNPDGSEEWEIEVKPNRMIVWPSNFLYPHTVKPVTKGTRYSVVAWAL
jgi:hypothetical protein